MSLCSISTPPTSTLKRTIPNSTTDYGVQKRRRSTVSKPRRGLRIAVEGNIATGKSTFLNIVETKIPRASCVQEPIERWTDVVDDDDEDGPSASQQAGGNLLGLFYKDPKRWAYTFQTYAFLSRLKAQMNAFKAHDKVEKEIFDASTEVTPTKQTQETPGRGVHILERSIYSDRLCFAAHCNASGLLSDMEYNIYTDFHTFVADNFEHLQLDGIIYLRSDPKVCNERLHKRARPEEDALPLSYLEAVHQRHEDWLVHNKTTSPGLVGKNVPILVLDCNNDFQNNEDVQATILKQTQEFVDKVEKDLDEKEDEEEALNSKDVA